MWFDTDGSEMANEDWNSANRCLVMLLSGDALDVRDPEGEPVRDDTFVFLFNAYHEPVKLPGKVNLGSLPRHARRERAFRLRRRLMPQATN